MMEPFEFRPPPLDANALVFPGPQWAAPFEAFLRDAPHPLKVISPCAGINAPVRALQELGMPWVSAGDYECNPRLKTALSDLVGGDAKVHCGSFSGDILNIPLSDLDLETDALISGPPCPPFSTMGCRLGELDPRSAVFITVAHWALHLARHGRLAFWVIENVPGIKKRRAEDDQSFAAWFVAEMSASLPAGWRVKVQEHNSAWCLLPQSRDRLFFVGVSPMLRQSPLQKRVLAAPLLRRPAVDLIHFLDMTDAPKDVDTLTLRQHANLLHYAKRFDALTSAATTVGVVDVARDPMRDIDSGISVGGVRTLRTNNSHLWILPGPAYRKDIGSMGRFLNRSEKCRVAGVVPSSLASLSDRELSRAIGNTIPVALCGHVLFPLCRAWVHASRPSLSWMLRPAPQDDEVDGSQQKACATLE